MPGSKPGSSKVPPTVYGITTTGAEDWTDEFLYISPGSGDSESLLLKKPAAVKDAKRISADDDDNEAWDLDDEKLTPPKKLSFRLAADPPSIDKYQETDDCSEFDDDVVIGDVGKLSKLPQPPFHEGLTDAEDWDNEFGINQAVEQNQHSMAQGFKHLIKDVADFGHIGDDTNLRLTMGRKDFEAYAIPNKCRIVSQLVEGCHQGHTIIRYPKGCEMDGLLFDGKRKVLSGQPLEQWLEQMVSQHEQMLRFMDKERTVAWLNGKRNKESRLALNELIATREVIETLYRKKDTEACFEQLRAFAPRLKSLARWLRPTSRKAAIGDSKEQSKATRRLSQESDRTQFFRNLMSILHVAGILDMDLKEMPVDLHLSKATAEFKGSTKTMGRSKRLSAELLKAAADCLPEYKDAFAVLELRIGAHYLANFADHRVIDFRLQDSKKGPPRGANLAFNICSSYLKLYYRIIDGLHMLGKHPTEMDTPSLQTVVSILADLYFFMNGISPLTLQFSQKLMDHVEELGELPGSDHEGDNSVGTEEEEYQSDEDLSESELSSEGEMHANDDDASDDWDDFDDDTASEPNVMGTPGRKPLSSSVSFSTSAEDGASGSPSLTSSHLGERRTIGMSAITQRRKSRARTQYRLEERINIGGEDDPRELLQLIQSDPALYKDMLLQDYRRFPELTWAKQRAALALGGLCRQCGDDVAAEMFYIEGLFVLTKLSISQTDMPLLSDTGCYTLEKVGDILVRNDKYKFGIVALEASIQCHQLQHTSEERRLYRKLSLTTQEHKDIARSLKYNSYMLRIAYDAHNFTEFVFVADVLSRLLMELGAFQQAENVMRIASQLLDGMPSSYIVFRTLDDDVLIPADIELPAISQTIVHNTEPHRRRRLHEVPSTPSSMQNMAAASSGLLDSQQLQLQLKIADTLMTAYKHQQAVDVLKRLLRRRIPSQSRAAVLMKVARCYLKLRLIGACEASLNRLTQEADEVIAMLADRGGENANLSATTAAVGLVSIVRSVEFFVCRCRARLAIDDPTTALHWLAIAFAICPKGKFGQLGQLHYLQGRAYERLCLLLHDHDTGEIMDIDEEARMAKLAEDNFRQAYSHYRSTDDFVHQVKSLTRIAQLHATRLFPLVALRGIPASEALNGTGSQVLQEVEEAAALALELAGDLASPLPLAFTLIAFAEISFLQGRPNLAQSAWAETQALLRLTYLQQTADDIDEASGTWQQPVLGDAFCPTSNPAGFFDQTRNVTHTPLFGMPLPTVPHPPGLMLRLHSILTRLVRLAFVLRPSRLSTHSELLGSWMRFDAHATSLHRSFEAMRPSTRRHSKFDVADHIAQNVVTAVEASSATRVQNSSPRLQHPLHTRAVIPPDRRRPSKRFARFVRIAEGDHIITIRADPTVGQVGAGGAIVRPMPSHASIASEKNARRTGVASMTDVMQIIKHALALDVGVSALPKGVSAIELVMQDLQRKQAMDFYTSMNPDGTIVQKEGYSFANQPHARMRGRSATVGFDYPREPATPAVGDEHAQAYCGGHAAQFEENCRELLCAAYFLQLRMYTRKYVSGKMALSHFARRNMETLQHLVKSSPYLRGPRSESWSGNEETKQPASPTPNDRPQRDATNEMLKTPERPAFQSLRQDSFRTRMRRRSTQDEQPVPKRSHRSQLSDGHAAVAATAVRNSPGNGSPRQAVTLNLSSQQSSKTGAYPSSFRFCIYMDGCFLFHCPNTDTRQVVPLLKQSVAAPPNAERPRQNNDSNIGNRPSTLSLGEEKSESIEHVTSGLEDSILGALHKLPLEPGEEAVLSAMDDALTVIVERLGYKYVLFLVNALMHEQPVLFLASPGHEEALIYCATALLRLIRPLQWQHLYIPLIHCSMRSMLRSVVNAKIPFVMGAYHDILDSLMVEGSHNEPSGNPHERDIVAFGEARSRATLFKTISYQALAHVTIVDLDSAVIIPGSGLRYAAATTMSASPVPDIDRGIVDFILEQQNATRAKEVSQSFLPPLPPRYRLALHQRMDVASTALLPAELQDKDKMKRRISHNSAISNPSVGFFGAQCVAEAFRGGLFTVMVSLYKGLRLFVYDPTTTSPSKQSRRRVVSERRGSNSRQTSVLRRMFDWNRNTVNFTSQSAEDRAAPRPIPEAEAPFYVTDSLVFDCHGFIQFLKDDVRPYMRCLMRTAAFKSLVLATVEWASETNHDAVTEDSYMRMFFTAAQQRMEQKLRIYSSVAEKRVVGYLLNYFVRAVPAEQEQPHQFVHQFPYMPTESTKVKRRWCVLDAQRLTYFRSHSKGRIKDHIMINTDNVRLVNSPFSGHEGTQTNESDYFALVIGESRVIVLRAELRQSHDKWLQALRARLLHENAKARMDMLYGGLKATL